MLELPAPGAPLEFEPDLPLLDDELPLVPLDLLVSLLFCATA
jgi:hypothetical protein